MVSIQNPDIYIGSIRIQEPVTVATDFLVVLACFFVYYKSAVLQQKTYIKLYRYFFLVTAISTLVSAIIGHAFLYHFGFNAKIYGPSLINKDYNAKSHTRMHEVLSKDDIKGTKIIPVDLNCLLYNLEQTMAEAYTLAGNSEKIELYESLYQKRKKAIEKYCWNPAKQFYFDFDFKNGVCTDSYTLAAVFPLFFKVATTEQAIRVAETLESQFLKPGGVTTTLVFSGQQWDAPNGWAPLQWMSFKGLMNYGFTALANCIKDNWLNANLKVYEKTGKMTEKYDVCNEDAEAGGGEYPNQDGFGWTNGVFLALSKNKD